MSAVQPAPTFADACREHFGRHPDDVLLPLDTASETLMQLSELFKTISEAAHNPKLSHRVKALADMGAHIAFDFGNFADCEHETMLNNLKAAGIVRVEQEGAA